MSDDVLQAVRDSLAGVHMDRPVAEIAARGRARRRHRRLAAVSVAAGVILAAALAVTVARPDAPAPADSLRRPAAPTTAMRLESASFTLTRSTSDVVTVRWKDAAADPDALRQALRDAGIPALVWKGRQGRDRPVCRTYATPTVTPSVRPYTGLRGGGLEIDGNVLPEGAGVAIMMYTNAHDAVSVVTLGLVAATSGPCGTATPATPSGR
jgi:hypothetical protein